MDTALKPVRACATVVASSYSAWRVYPALWFPACAGMTVLGFSGLRRCIASFCGYCLEASMTGRRWLVWLVVALPCGYCLEASMTGRGLVVLACFTHALWIPAYAGMTVWWVCLAVTLTFDSSPIKGEGILGLLCFMRCFLGSVCVGCFGF